MFVGGEPPTPTGPDAASASEKAEAWAAWLRALAWVCYGHQDLGALTKAQFGALTAEAKRMFAEGFRRTDLQAWLDEEWRPQWAGHFARHGSYPRPRPDQVRAGIPTVRASSWEVALPQAADTPAKAAPPHPTAPLDATWRVVQMEVLAAYPPGADARRWLEGSRLVEAEPVDGVPLYQVQLASPEGESWVRDRLAVPVRRSLKSLLGKAVLVDVTAPELEAA